LLTAKLDLLTLRQLAASRPLDLRLSQSAAQSLSLCCALKRVMKIPPATLFSGLDLQGRRSGCWEVHTVGSRDTDLVWTGCGRSRAACRW